MHCKRHSVNSYIIHNSILNVDVLYKYRYFHESARLPTIVDIRWFLNNFYMRRAIIITETQSNLKSRLAWSSWVPIFPSNRTPSDSLKMTGENENVSMEPPHIYVERTLAIIKPDALQKAEEIEDIILRSGFSVLQVFFERCEHHCDMKTLLW